MRKYFISAIALHEERFRDTGITCNALITLDKLQEFCPMDDSFETLMKIVFDRILRVARNIADIDGSEMVR
ncbi:hypothetical protein [Ruminococcus sp.]|uniref:magnesium chelatase subunit ChlI family protein n=1 Tax=Ruminococcus sp. TaxID=41978 RepID=UPI001B431237|nr:hypothetical protein [Ruminococcus sp.]